MGNSCFNNQVSKDFYSYYQFDFRTKIPEVVLINELAREMQNIIHHLQQDELHLFTMGLSTHLIAMQIQCTAVALDGKCILLCNNIQYGNWRELIPCDG